MRFLEGEPLIAEGPEMSACAECWRPEPCPEHPDALYHRWQAQAASLVLTHPALSGPVVGRFRYPVDARKLPEFIARHVASLKAIGLRPKNCTLRVEPDADIPQDILDRLQGSS